MKGLRILWGPLPLGVFSTQRVSTLRHMYVSVPVLGEAYMRRIERKKTAREKLFMPSNGTSLKAFKNPGIGRSDTWGVHVASGPSRNERVRVI